MRRFPRVVLSGIALCCAAALATASCSSSDDDITLADFAGVWDAVSYQVTSKDNPALSVDVIALGGSMVTTVDVDGRLVGTANIPDPSTGGMLTFPFAGAFILVDQETLIIDFQPDIPPYFTDETVHFDLSGDTLVLESPETGFDWDADGVPDPSTFRGEMRRR